MRGLNVLRKSLKRRSREEELKREIINALLELRNAIVKSKKER